MIRLTIAPEPASFTKTVREPGENALALLAGKPLPHKRPGRPISDKKTVGGKSVQKTVNDFAYWQDCLDDLHTAYHGICAYYGFHVEKASLPQVDHFIAKHTHEPRLAYEWSNYRLACGYANVCKNEYPDVLDPAAIEDGWFQIEMTTLGVRADPQLSEAVRKTVEETITRLRLSENRALEVRQRVMEHFRSGRVKIEFLELDHPFLAKELARQGIHTSAQLTALPPQVVKKTEQELIAE